MYFERKIQDTDFDDNYDAYIEPLSDFVLGLHFGNLVKRVSSSHISVDPDLNH